MSDLLLSMLSVALGILFIAFLVFLHPIWYYIKKRRGKR